MTRALNLTVVIVSLAFLAGCDSVVGFENGASATVHGLKIHLSAPDTVAVSDSFKVRFVVENPTYEPIAVTTSCCYFIRLSITRNGNVVPFKGSRRDCFCLPGDNTHRIPPTGLLKRTYDVQAVLSTPEGEKPASPGHYTIRADLHWSIEGEKVDLSMIGRELVVQPLVRFEN